MKEEKKNKELLFVMWILMITTTLLYLGVTLLAIMMYEEGIVVACIVITATILFLIDCFVVLKLEASIGYHECKSCKNRFSPTYKEVVLAPHYGTTRYLKCTKCGKRTFAKKVMTK